MVVVTVALPALVVLASLPYWLPRLVVNLRMRIFTRINGADGIPVPGDLVDITRFRRLYEHPATNGRSRGAALSDLFWYWLAPGPHVHQEHLEPGERYLEVARTTRRILAAGHARAHRLATDCAARVLNELGVRRARTVRLRDLMMPIWAEFYYELVFGERCPAGARTLIVDNADDVATALKCCGLRHMDRRDRLTRFLVAKIEDGAVPHRLPAGLSLQDKAYYLQGTFFNTAVVQSSEAMAHLLMALATHREVQQNVVAELVAEPSTDYLDRVLDETLRRWPLFGIAHRITSADVELDGGAAIPAGSVVCFSYPEFHQAGYEHPERFDPDRWAESSTQDYNHIPFGVVANRACPARGLAPVVMRAVTRETVRRFALFSSAAHTRSMPNRGPCLLLPRSASIGVPTVSLPLMRLRDRWADVPRGLTQLLLGTYMVWDARRQRLCERYFADQDGRDTTATPPVH
ncbi:MAG: cytochrome P450 [Actinophytocola sp.]|uniref:cytochrome P450 n=1 Tax=Actinophytocola sp. TaxID=1872138 RepID=UPI001327BDF7|nr:cytochrome P450 [Actinophytocola sp.]MPZ81897.1 cytochrome P450 [Actinophytocola sp.]